MDNLEEAIQSCDLEYLEHTGTWIEDPDMSTPIEHGLVDGNQGTQTAAIHKPGFRQIKIDRRRRRRQSCPDTFAEGHRVGRVEFRRNLHQHHAFSPLRFHEVEFFFCHRFQSRLIENPGAFASPNKNRS